MEDEIKAEAPAEENGEAAATGREKAPRRKRAAIGAACAAAAALAACIAHGKPLAETARLAIGAGALACTASETIHPGMSWENIRYILDKEEL